MCVHMCVHVHAHVCACACVCTYIGNRCQSNYRGITCGAAVLGLSRTHRVDQRMPSLDGPIRTPLRPPLDRMAGCTGGAASGFLKGHCRQNYEGNCDSWPCSSPSDHQFPFVGIPQLSLCTQSTPGEHACEVPRIMGSLIPPL